MFWLLFDIIIDNPKLTLLKDSADDFDLICQTMLLFCKLWVTVKRSHVCKQIEFHIMHDHVKFIYSEKATKFCTIFTLLLSYVAPVKSKVKILKSFVAFSEYMNFNKYFRFGPKLYFKLSWNSSWSWPWNCHRNCSWNFCKIVNEIVHENVLNCPLYFPLELACCKKR